MTTIGYARVSTDGQTLDAQQTSLTQAGCQRVYAEKISGAVTDRKALARAIESLGPETRSSLRVWTGSLGPLGTCSTSSTPSASDKRASSRSRTLGPTPRPISAS
jgi:hypothetical protein